MTTGSERQQKKSAIGKSPCELSMRCMVTTCGIKIHPVREAHRLARTGPGVFPEIDCVNYQQVFEYQAPRRRILAQNVSILVELRFLEVHSVRCTSCWKFYTALSGTGKGGFVGGVLGKDSATTQQTNARAHQAQAHSRDHAVGLPVVSGLRVDGEQGCPSYSPPRRLHDWVPASQTWLRMRAPGVHLPA
ncbi:hypothetical protein MRX96_030898 [Rhipicephalus microplus]